MLWNHDLSLYFSWDFWSNLISLPYLRLYMIFFLPHMPDYARPVSSGSRVLLSVRRVAQWAELPGWGQASRDRNILWSYWLLHSMETILYRVHCTALGALNRAVLSHTVQCTVYSVQFTPNIVQRALDSVQCTVYTSVSSLQSKIKCTVRFRLYLELYSAAVL